MAANMTELVAEAMKNRIITSYNLGPMMNVMSWMLLSSILVVILMVLVTKLIVVKCFMLDDYLLITSWLFFSAEVLTVNFQVSHGLGSPISTVNAQSLQRFKVDTFIAGTLYIISLIFAKLYTLVVVLHLTPVRKQRLIIKSVAVIVGIWGAISIAGGVFHKGSPVLSAEKSMNFVEEMTYLYTLESTHLVVNVLIMMLPIMLIYNLHTTRRKKMGVAGSFLCRFLVVIPAICRLYYAKIALCSEDYTLHYFAFTMCTQVELIMEIATSTFPHLRPFFKQFKESYLSAEIRVLKPDLQFWARYRANRGLSDVEMSRDAIRYWLSNPHPNRIARPGLQENVHRQKNHKWRPSLGSLPSNLFGPDVDETTTNTVRNTDPYIVPVELAGFNFDLESYNTSATLVGNTSTVVSDGAPPEETGVQYGLAMTTDNRNSMHANAIRVTREWSSTRVEERVQV